MPPPAERCPRSTTRRGRAAARRGERREEQQVAARLPPLPSLPVSLPPPPPPGRRIAGRRRRETERGRAARREQQRRSAHVPAPGAGRRPMRRPGRGRRRPAAPCARCRAPHRTAARICGGCAGHGCRSITLLRGGGQTGMVGGPGCPLRSAAGGPGGVSPACEQRGAQGWRQVAEGWSWAAAAACRSRAPGCCMWAPRRRAARLEGAPVAGLGKEEGMRNASVLSCSSSVK